MLRIYFSIIEWLTNLNSDIKFKLAGHKATVYRAKKISKNETNKQTNTHPPPPTHQHPNKQLTNKHVLLIEQASIKELNYVHTNIFTKEEKNEKMKGLYIVYRIIINQSLIICELC